MTAHPVLFGILCFGLGIALQAILMLQGAFRSGDAKRIGTVLLISLLGMIPGKHEHPYEPLWHVFMCFTILGGAFSFRFRKRLLPHVGARILLAWNIVLVFVALYAGWNSAPKVLLLAIPSALTVINAFTDIDRAFGWKVFFHAWFCTILVVITIVGLNTGPLAMFFERVDSAVARPPLEMFMSGAAYLYIITNAWFVLALWPTPIARGQSWGKRMEQVRRHMDLLAHGYVWERNDPPGSLVMLVCLPLMLFAALRSGRVGSHAIVSLAIAMIPRLAVPPPEAAELPPVTAPVRTKKRAHALRMVLPVALACAAFAGTGASAAPRAPAWQVYAIRYATIPAFPVRYLVAGADTTRKLDIAMMFWLIQGADGRRVLLDAGFYRQKFVDSWKPAGFLRPSDALQRFGMTPDSVTDVIVSHVHWDHLDGADLFPNARIWIQRQEYEHYVAADGTPAHAGIDSLDAAMLLGLMKAGRVELVEGDGKEILPGITAYTGGKHTFASQYVTVRMAKGTAVLASDNLYLYENLDRHAPIAQTLDAASNLAAQDRMKKLASSRRLIVPGHDPAVFQRFHAVQPGVARIE